MADDETQETPPESPPEPPKATWQKREFAINEKMRHVCKLTAKATEAEIASLKRKLRKIQYGS